MNASAFCGGGSAFCGTGKLPPFQVVSQKPAGNRPSAGKGFCRRTAVFRALPSGLPISPVPVGKDIGRGDGQRPTRRPDRQKKRGDGNRDKHRQPEDDTQPGEQPVDGTSAPDGSQLVQRQRSEAEPDGEIDQTGDNSENNHRSDPDLRAPIAEPAQ